MTKTREDYRYVPLPPQEGAFRLVKLSRLRDEESLGFTMRDEILGSAPSYLALSYAWGDDLASYRILVNGSQFWVRQNLWLFLTNHHERYRDSWIWIDSICIDQTNMIEKNEQVALMHQIYSNASKVVSWLPDAAQMLQTHDINQELSQDLAKVIRSQSSETCYSSIDTELVAAAFVRLLSNVYWSRLWVMQEVQVAQRLEFQWGNQCFRKLDLKNAIVRLTNSPEVSEVIQRRWSKDATKLAVYSNTVLDDAGVLDTGPLLLDLMLTMDHATCSLPHDRAYALLALAKNGHLIKPDYSECTLYLLARLLHYHPNDVTLDQIHAVARLLGVNAEEPFQIVSWWQCGNASRSDLQADYPSINFTNKDKSVTVCDHCTNLHQAFRSPNHATHGIIAGIPSVDFYFGLKLTPAKKWMVEFIFKPHTFDDLCNKQYVHYNQILWVSSKDHFVSQDGRFQYGPPGVDLKQLCYFLTIRKDPHRFRWLRPAHYSGDPGKDGVCIAYSDMVPTAVDSTMFKT